MNLLSGSAHARYLAQSRDPFHGPHDHLAVFAHGAQTCRHEEWNAPGDAPPANENALFAPANKSGSDRSGDLLGEVSANLVGDA
ncbi:hypothetical protein G5B40_14865 [Pikeienuella piscinae]|uniref:Uncharacterized protein n=1 Tax=Pikeienuella piscinae TaxID=2748098 RepID=A0A7L5C258_9RHOB|nr:hypothetical protein [Pikeienuella piscinae]QIE56606.1 hypothetical protein G5B40_14865 [Pikeienuella piscinae]